MPWALIAQIVIEIIRLIISFRQSRPSKVDACTTAWNELQEARKAGDLPRLQALKDRLKNERCGL